MELFESENSIFNGNEIIITNRRLIIDDDVYLVNAITSIKRSNIEKNVPLITIVIASCLLCLGLFLLARNDTSGSTFMGLSFVVFLIALVVWIGQKASYKIIIHFSSGEIKSIEDRDMEYIEKIFISLNDTVTKNN